MASRPLAGVMRYLHRVSGSAGFELPDAELVALFAAERDSAAFEALVRRHGSLVMGICRRVLGAGPDVDDAFQAAFLVLARKAGSIRLRDSLAGWLHRVAFNLSLQLRKKRAVRHRHEIALDSTEPITPMTSDPVHQASLRELAAVLDEELLCLPAVCRAAVVACHLEGLATAEAAHQLGVPASTLKSRLQRGRELLRKRLESRGIGLSAMGLVVLLVEQSRGALSYGVVRTTVEAAVSFAASGTGAVSSQAAALAVKALKTTALGKMKLMAFGVLGFGLLGFGAAAVPTRMAAPPLPPGKMSTRLAQNGVKEPIARDQQGDPLPAGAIARLGSTRWRHDHGVDFAAFLPDGKTVITTSADFIIRFWEFPSGKEIRRIDQSSKTSATYTGLVALSKDGKTIATCFDGGKIRLRDVATGKELPALGKSPPDAAEPSAVVGNLAFSPDGQTLASLDKTGTIRIWNLAEGKVLREIGGPNDVPVGKKIRAAGTLIYAPNGRALGTIYSTSTPGKPKETGGLVKLWDPATGIAIRSIPFQGSMWPLFSFSPDSKTIAFSTFGADKPFGGGGPSALALLEVATGKEIRKVTGRNAASEALLFGNDGTKLFVSGSVDSVQEFAIASGKLLRTLGVTQDYPVRIYGSHMSLSPDGNTLVLPTGLRAPMFIDVPSGKRVGSTAGHTRPVVAIRFAFDGKSLLTEDSNHSIMKWDAATGSEMSQAGLREPTFTSKLSPDGKVEASWVGDLLLLFDAETGKELVRVRPKTADPRGNFGETALCYAQNGKTLAVRQRGFDNIYLFEIPSGKLLQAISVVALANRIQMGNLPKGPLPPRQVEATDVAQLLYFSPDSTVLASNLDPNRLGLWDAATGRLIASVAVPERSAISGAFTPDSRALALDMNDGTVKLFEVASGKLRRVYGKTSEPTRTSEPGWTRVVAGHHFGAALVAFTPDGKSLAHAGPGGIIRMWRIDTGQQWASFQGHAAAVNAIAISPNGKTLVSASADTTSLVWDLSKIDGPPAAAKRLERAEIEACWEALISEDAAKAFTAIGDLSSAPKAAVDLLKERVKPAAALDRKQVQHLIGQLDDPDFKVRESAGADLLMIGEQVVPIIDDALSKELSLETRSRLDGLRGKLRSMALTGEQLRGHRAVEILENIGTPQARLLLQILAGGAPGAHLTTIAQAALRR